MRRKDRHPPTRAPLGEPTHYILFIHSLQNVANRFLEKEKMAGLEGYKNCFENTAYCS